MRKTLTAAAALAPLWFAAGEAAAQTTISSSTSTPVATATATSGTSAGDITIASGGTINLTGPNLSGVTVNSNNNFTNTGGLIQASDINSVVGVQVNGGNTGTVDNDGTISFKDSSSPSTDSTTGVTQGPWAPDHNGVSPTDRIGILVTGSSPFVGNIINDSAGAISITGNSSYGIKLDGAMTGNLSNLGSIAVVGDNSAGVYISHSGGINGSFLSEGAISATGQNASAIVVNGAITGRFSLYSTTTATAYGSTSRSVSDVIQADIQNVATEVEKGGTAVAIGASVGQGIYIGAAPANTLSTSTADLDGDGLEDGGETTGSISSYGNQPALVIGAAGQAVNIGTLQLTSTGSNSNLLGYGLVVSGSISAAGVQDYVPATAIQIGAVSPDTTNSAAGSIGAIAASSSTGALSATGSTVNIAGGLYINSGGSVTASSNGADAVGIHILGGSTVPKIGVDGTLSADASSPLPNATTGVATPYNGSSYALVIEKNAEVDTLTVGGAITASTTGDGASPYTNNATAVIDYGGKLSTVNLTGSISATITPTVSTTTPGGTTTALDLSANTTGVSLKMSQADLIKSVATTTDGTTTTVTSDGGAATSPNYSGAVISTSTTSGNVTTTTTTPMAPSITGSVYLGAGTNVVDMEAGTFQGELSVNAGDGLAGQSAGVSSSAATTATITLNNSAIFLGALKAGSATTFDFEINSGTFTDTYPQTLQATKVHIGSTGVFSFAIDPANSRNTTIVSSGPVTIDSGAKLGINVLSNITGIDTVTLIKATNGGLTVNTPLTSLAGDVPYLFFATATQTTNEIDLLIREKTPAELGANAAQGAALPAIYDALNKNPTIQAALFGQYDKGSFFKLYNQLMPDYTGGLFRAASEAARTISRLTADPNQIENPTGSRGAWAQQFFVGAYQGRGEALPFNAGGFGYAGGVETGGLGFGAVGATAAFIALNETNPQLPNDNRQSLSELEVGLYWQGELSGLTLDARVGAGYDWFSGRRQFLTYDSSGTINYNVQTKGNWNGYSLVGHFGAAYQIDLGSVFFLKPEVQADYFRLNQNAYTEHGGAAGFNLALDGVTGDEASASALLAFGAKYGRTVVWRPEIQFGVRDIFSGNSGTVSGVFVDRSVPFSVNPEDYTGPAGVARIKFKGSSEYYEVGIEGGVEARSRYSEGDAKVSVRVLF